MARQVLRVKFGGDKPFQFLDLQAGEEHATIEQRLGLYEMYRRGTVFDVCKDGNLFEAVWEGNALVPARVAIGDAVTKWELAAAMAMIRVSAERAMTIALNAQEMRAAQVAVARAGMPVRRVSGDGGRIRI